MAAIGIHQALCSSMMKDTCRVRTAPLLQYPLLLIGTSLFLTPSADHFTW